MRFLYGLVMAGCLTLGAVVGCDPSPEYDGETIDKFDGQLLHNGQPVSFDKGEKVKLRLIYKAKAETFGIPIKPDGTFQIGWMPIGDYAANLERTKPNAGGRGGGRPEIYPIPGGLTIEKGKTRYEVELGEKWKP
jgi:hypothetical protein